MLKKLVILRVRKEKVRDIEACVLGNGYEIVKKREDGDEVWIECRVGVKKGDLIVLQCFDFYEDILKETIKRSGYYIVKEEYEKNGYLYRVYFKRER